MKAEELMHELEAYDDCAEIGLVQWFYNKYKEQAYIIAKEAVDSKSKWLYDKKGKLNVIFEKAPKYGTPEYYEWLYGE